LNFWKFRKSRFFQIYSLNFQMFSYMLYIFVNTSPRRVERCVSRLVSVNCWIFVSGPIFSFRPHIGLFFKHLTNNHIYFRNQRECASRMVGRTSFCVEFEFWLVLRLFDFWHKTSQNSNSTQNDVRPTIRLAHSRWLRKYIWLLVKCLKNSSIWGLKLNMGPDTKIQQFTETSRETHRSTRLGELFTKIYNIYENIWKFKE